MNEYDDLVEESAAMSETAAEERGNVAADAPRSTCSRWMYHRPGVFCHACKQTAGKTVKGVSLHLDLPPGGKAKSDFKKPKAKKGEK